MSVISSFNSLDKRFAWSFLGFMLAAVFGSITIYTEFFRVDTPSIVVEVISDANVLDVKEDINELKVFYGDVDIKSLNQTLSVLFLRVRNNGGAPILNGYYDNNYPFNITLSEGKFLKVELLNATNDYLKSAALSEIKKDKSISLPEVILEPEESYTIKILALHSASSNIEIDVIGKIAGIKKIQLAPLNAEKTKLSFWNSVFYGDWSIQLARLPIYFFGFILSLFVVIFPIAFASDTITKRKRKKVVMQYKDYSESEPIKFQDIIFDTYISDGLSPLAEAKEMLTDKDSWQKTFKRGSSRSMENDENSFNSAEMNVIEKAERSSPYSMFQSEKLIKQIGALTKSDEDEIILDVSAELALSKFIDFVVIKES
ncbi:hypothetical protein [Vibrio sp. A2-1]|uniref:hypothetical protein n=1 Tax=Vibrio sp. A2-1 TaxID=2912252 RepID=UPI001F43E9B3|nr:hypothetical protein [Vibrio sp. A2-1]MCF7487106.1 hypothetical protein [Vibrio sp. A2-1]